MFGRGEFSQLPLYHLYVYSKIHMRTIFVKVLQNELKNSTCISWFISFTNICWNLHGFLDFVSWDSVPLYNVALLLNLCILQVSSGCFKSKETITCRACKKKKDMKERNSHHAIGYTGLLCMTLACTLDLKYHSLLGKRFCGSDMLKWFFCENNGFYH